MPISSMSSSARSATRRSARRTAGKPSAAVTGSRRPEHRDRAPTAMVWLTVRRAEQPGVLERSSQSPQRTAARSERGDVTAVQHDPTGVRHQEARNDVEQGGLAGTVGADEPEDLAVVQPDRDVVEGRDAGEALGHSGGLEHHAALPVARTGDLLLSPRLGRCRRCGRRRRVRRRALEEHGAQEFGPLQQLAGAAVEADLALLHEVGGLRHRQRDVDGLLDQDDRRAALAQLLDHLEQLRDDQRRQSE